MALLDHFHPPLSRHRFWHSFHNGWATYIATNLNQHLPEGYFAQPNAQFGIEIDMATFQGFTPFSMTPQSQEEGYLTPSTAGWMPSAPTQTIPFHIVSDSVEVQIYSSEEGPILVGAIELVSPANKDRATHRRAFVSKCETYLQQGIGLVVVDIVTNRKANLHNELLAHLHTGQSGFLEAKLYATAYRLVNRSAQPSLDMWNEPLTIGQPLPIMPLWLHSTLCLPLDLNKSYLQTCRAQRII